MMEEGEGGGGLRVIFWVYERCQDFFGLQKKKTEGFFWVANKSSDFFG